MPVDPGTAILIATAVASAAKGAGDYFSGKGADKAAKRRAKEMRRETEADVLDQALNRSAELEASRLQGRNRLGKRRAQSSQDTADLLRGALNI